VFPDAAAEFDAPYPKAPYRVLSFTALTPAGLTFAGPAGFPVPFANPLETGWAAAEAPGVDTPGLAILGFGTLLPATGPAGVGTAFAESGF
jgi:hypothetical protein